VCSDNGLISQNRRCREACRDYRLQQEFTTPYTPKQNGLIERFFRSLKEECAWQHAFPTFEDARTTTDGHTATWAIGTAPNTGRNNQPRLLDFRGTLYQHLTGTSSGHMWRDEPEVGHPGPSKTLHAKIGQLALEHDYWEGVLSKLALLSAPR
jgi:transposase InsO family protein